MNNNKYNNNTMMNSFDFKKKTTTYNKLRFYEKTDQHQFQFKGSERCTNSKKCSRSPFVNKFMENRVYQGPNMHITLRVWFEVIIWSVTEVFAFHTSWAFIPITQLLAEISIVVLNKTGSQIFSSHVTRKLYFCWPHSAFECQEILQYELYI